MTKRRVGIQLHPQHTTYESFATAVRQVEALAWTPYGIGIIFSRSMARPTAPA